MINILCDEKLINNAFKIARERERERERQRE